MIRVTIEVDQIGQQFKIERSDEYFASDLKATETVDRLISEARASMYGALKAVPQLPVWMDQG